MKRTAMEKLKAWKARADRKPLLLHGVRQVGKTWIVQTFGEQAYENVVYCNFAASQGLRNLFAQTKNPARILALLALLHGEPVRAGRTLLVFDEAQACPDMAEVLKAFCAQARGQHVIAVSSLPLPGAEEAAEALDRLTLSPLTFAEFLAAADDHLAQAYASLRPGSAIQKATDERLLDACRQYFLVGGLPACVAAWADRRDPRRVRELQQGILAAFERDFEKGRSRIRALRLRKVFRSMAQQLASENEKFIYDRVQKGARAREFQEAARFLAAAGLAYRIPFVSAPHAPLASYARERQFKLFPIDTGLFHAMRGTENGAVLFDQPFPGRDALFEIFVLEQCAGKVAFHTYAPDAQHAIDFLWQRQGEVFPITVRPHAEKNLARYLKKFQPPAAFCYTMQEAAARKEGKTIRLPLYLAGRTEFLEMHLH